MEHSVNANLGQKLTATEDNLNQRLAAFDSNIKAVIADDCNKLLKWTIGLLLGQSAILATLMKLL